MTAQPAVEQIWLHDDQEEDLVGTDWHQRAIDGVFDALQDVAEVAGLPWHVGNQHTLVARMPDGRFWRPCPDIMVHPHAGSAPRAEMVVAADGPPALVIEVVSPTTWHYDVDDVQGKAAGYLALGVPEYLLFDPTGAYLRAPCRGWRQADGKVAGWLPDPGGWYRSAVLGIAFRPEGAFLRTYDPLGRLVPSREERRYESTRLQAEQERQVAENARLRAEQERQVAENARLRAEQERQAAEIASLRAALERARRGEDPGAAPLADDADHSR
jgi:Uma2 family endonuclease